MKVHASYEAGTYIRERGGALYVWIRPVSEALGMIGVSTEAPTEASRLDQIDAGGFELFLDPELQRPRRVEITLRRTPWRRIRVRGFVGQLVGEGGGDVGGPIWDTHGAGPGGDGGGGNGGGGNGGGG